MSTDHRTVLAVNPPRRLNPEEVRATVERLTTNPLLTTVRLRKTLVGDVGAIAAAEALRAHNRLTCLRIDEQPRDEDDLPGLVTSLGATALAEALSVTSSLRTLSLFNNFFVGDEGAAALAEALRSNRSLTSLDLTHCGLSAVGAVALAEALEVNTSLETLALFRNEVEDLGAEALAAMLRSNRSLKSLSVSNIFTGVAGIVALATALEANSSLVSLTLGSNEVTVGRNEVGDRGAAALAEALRTNRSLTTLELTGCYVRPAGVAALASALEADSSLTTLVLDGNFVGDEGAAALARALRANAQLGSLGLMACHITREGANHLAEALKVNEHLRALDLRHNHFGGEGAADPFLQALKVNDSLTTLNLTFIGPTQRAEIKTKLARNAERREVLRRAGGPLLMLQLTLLPAGSPDDPVVLAVTTMGGTELLRMPLERKVKLQEVYARVRTVRDVPRAAVRWVLPDGQVVEYLGGVPVVEALTAATTRANQVVVAQTSVSTL